MTRRHHIMILDDEPNIGLSLRLILEGEGFRVTICDSAAQFQAERSRARADLYLLDVRLPDGNGIDVHDSGPGLSAAASATLFEPTISFKKQGMGLGLSIAKKNAMLSNGDLSRLDGELGGAAFRVSLRRADAAIVAEWAS